MQLSDILKQLLILLADGKFHSGTALAAALGMSRSAIWKQLQALNELGVELVAVSGKGYKLPQAMQLLDSAAISAMLDEQPRQLMAGLEIFDVIDSTNQYLLEQARSGAPSGLVCAAEYQTAGKGRRGRVWVSPFGHNLYLSILWRYQDSPAAIAGLSLALGVAVIRALRQFGLNDVGLKWPNDIYWRQQKLAGILVEVSGENGGPCHAVVGLGVNFYLSAQQGQSIEQPYADIRSILGDTAYLRRNQLMTLILNQLLPVIGGYQTGSLRAYLDEWRSYDCMAGKAVQIQIADTRHAGTVVGINDDGMLLIENAAGQVQTFASGEVSLKLA